MSIGNIANSGMKVAMSDMEVISNNISNVNTIGYKRSSATFSDMYPSMNSGQQPGIGVQLNGIKQDFSIGQVEEGFNGLSMMIRNEGFFVTKDSNSGITTYTRAGAFELDNDGYVISSITRQRLQGYAATNASLIDNGSLSDLKISTAPINAKPTASVTQNVNLDSNSSVPSGAFSATDASTYNFETSQSIYDSLGNEHKLSTYYVKTASNTWDVHALVDGTSIGTGAATFDSSGQLLSATGLSSLSFSPTGGAASPQSFSLSLTSSTQFASNSTKRDAGQDGAKVGILDKSSVRVDNNGNITGKYSNGESLVLLGKVGVALFPSNSGLSYVGNMSWQETGDSGAALISQSNSDNAIAAGKLELSNVDLTEEMINLINAQHNFQANAQVEQVYNEVMQTIINI